MHIQTCLKPKRIFNKYTQEWQYVPCGSCAACLKRKASEWVTRLDVERKCWKYCLFGTLTYSDENVPYLENLDDNYLIDLTHEHQAPAQHAPLIYLPELFKDLSSERRSNLISFIDSRDKFPYLSVYDAQKFIKRLRKNLYNTIKTSYKDYNEKDYFVRYYLVGEYGSTTYRPHYHFLLFFSSEKEAAYIQEVVRKSWTLGIVDTSFVAESNSSYLAKYLNCYSGMPEIYTHKSIRPFSIFSKSTPIGTLYFNDSKVQELFDSCSPVMLADYYKGVSLKRVPLWKTFENRLFPKLALFDSLSHFDRVRLYRACIFFAQNYPLDFGAGDFAHYMYSHHVAKEFGTGYLHVYDDYISALQENSEDIINTLIRWYGISKRVYAQSCAFDISIEEYVEHIERYYINKESESLKEQLKFEDGFAKVFSPAELIGIDKLYLEKLLDVPLDLLSAEEITTLESFGIDVERFTSDNLSERLEYQYTLMPENTRDFLNVVIDSGVWLQKHTKTKIKNDYLNSHPELINFYNKTF